MSNVLHLCATTRLAQSLRAVPPAPGAAVWATPRAATVGAWLDEVLEEACLLGLCEPLATLDAHGERLLWERVIADSLEASSAPLFDVRAMAASAAEAQALVETWNLHPTGEMGRDSAPETRLFLDWQREFRRRCAARGWRTAAQRQKLAVELVETGRFALPDAVHFHGFDRHTPVEKRLREALAAQGVAVVDPAPAAESEPAVRLLACPDALAECRAAAAWARERLARQPDARLGIVAPDLGAVRETLEFALDDGLHPELVRPAACEAPRRWNFSLGRPLSAQPVVRAALELIGLGTARRIEQSRLSALVLDPFWSAGESEGGERARLDAAMRRHLDYHTSLPALLRLARWLIAREDESRVACPQLIRHLEAFAEAAGKAAKKRLPSAWAGVFRDWLKALGWPGERTLSSHEYQAREAFLECVDGLARLDDILGPVPAAEAARRLAHAAGEAVFQPKTSGRPAVQALGMLESTGLEFDALWVMGMNDHLWPAAPRPNPLLPAELQRRAGSPHAGAEVELQFAAAVQARLLGAAPDITFSFARMDGNRLLRPSPLLPEIAAGDWQAVADATLPTPPERLPDATAPAVVEGEKVRGGTGLLKAQAICPAWGFYQYRLGARALEAPVEGFSASERGSLVHLALEAFWRETRTLSALKAQAPDERRTRIEAAVAAALTRFEEETHREVPARYRTLEAARLARLLDRWLDKEAARTWHFTVAACEQEVILDIEGIRVRTVLDRIDQLDDGRRLVIDYKTGNGIDTRNWAEERITEPQLPIYAALAADGEVAGAAFARVRADALAFAGVAENDGLLPGLVGLDGAKRKHFEPHRFPDWPSVLAHWRARLAAIAAEVKAGVAGVTPLDEAQLLYCEVKPLLRLAERRQQLEMRDAAGEAGHD